METKKFTAPSGQGYELQERGGGDPHFILFSVSGAHGWEVMKAKDLRCMTEELEALAREVRQAANAEAIATATPESTGLTKMQFALLKKVATQYVASDEGDSAPGKALSTKGLIEVRQAGRASWCLSLTYRGRALLGL